jgi:hypothetical protein
MAPRNKSADDVIAEPISARDIALADASLVVF